MADSQEVSGGGSSGSSSSEVLMCANGCGFFGNAATKNLCSKCYKEHLTKTADAGAALVAEKKVDVAKAAATHVSEHLPGQDPDATAAAAVATATPVAEAPTSSTEQDNSGAIECANGCGFFGSAATKNMCSGCYRDFLNNAHASAAVADKVVVVLAAEQPAAAQISAAAVKAAAQKPNRCASCRRKVGLLGFPCRCGATFCSLHRYAEKHACDFDVKTADREKIVKNNPLVVAPKLNKM